MAKHVERNLPNDDIEQQLLPDRKPRVNIYVEKMHSIYYAWEDNKHFLFQHNDSSEMAKMLMQKYPNHEVNIEEKLV